MNRHLLGPLQELHVAKVLDNADPDSRGRIHVRLQATGLETWASVVVPSAGSGYGVACLPRKDEMVVLAFISPDLPLVLGALWSGASSTPADSAPIEDRYLLQTPQGLKVLLDDQGPQIQLMTPGGHQITVTDAGGGTITVQRGTDKVELASAGISVTSSAKVKVQGNQVEFSAPMVKIDAAMVQFSGVVKCTTLISNSVVGTAYVQGAGNLW